MRPKPLIPTSVSDMMASDSMSLCVCDREAQNDSNEYVECGSEIVSWFTKSQKDFVGGAITMLFKFFRVPEASTDRLPPMGKSLRGLPSPSPYARNIKNHSQPKHSYYHICIA